MSVNIGTDIQNRETGDIDGNAGVINLGDGNLTIQMILSGEEAVDRSYNISQLIGLSKKIQDSINSNIDIKCINEDLITKIIDLVTEIISEVKGYFRQEKLDYVLIEDSNFTFIF